ncbi:MAG: aminopeptidase P family protein [Christensenellaceae bacterium]|nr:aminopeptidase P family protein [Christensenellaceae bacterium]
MKKLDDIRKLLCADAALITYEPDVAWLTEFTGDSSSVLITEKNAYFLTDFRYTEQAKNEIDDCFEVVEVPFGKFISVIENIMSADGAYSVGIDYTHTTLNDMDTYGDISAEILDISGILPMLRSIKTQKETERMKRGAKITENAFYHMLGIIKEGVSERDLYAEMIYFFHKNGVEPSFTPIIASGENSSMPHARISDRRLKKGDFITMDFGVKYEGICTDFTRTVALFGVEEQQKMIYNTVKYAQSAALEALRPGISGREADAAARDIINAAGYADSFGHGTGHGVGVEIHEAPRLSLTSESVLSEGMVVTVEPGIYLAGKMGVRIEDMAVITKDGCENFYTADKELIII